MIFEYSYEPEYKLTFRKLKKLVKAEELLELDGIGSQLDVAAFSKKFFSKKGRLTTADISVDANSNVDDVDVVQYPIEVAKPLHRFNSYYLLWKYASDLFSEEKAYEMMKAQFTKEIYCNDFHSYGYFPYCFNYSCMDVVFRGLPFVTRIKSRPPKHLSSFMAQMVQFVTYCSNSTVGAIGLADLLICTSWYVGQLYKEIEKDKEYSLSLNRIWKQIKQELQSFIFSVNQPSRNGSQSPFTNVSIFDGVFLEKLCKEYVFPDGTNPNIDLVKSIQITFMDLMNETLKETPVTFPVTTACFAVNEKKEILDSEFLELIIGKNLEFGFMNIYAGETSTLSSCCRLRSNTTNEYFNMFGSGGTKIGSMGVVTLNLPRIAYESNKNQEKFLERLAELVVLASQINWTKRTILKKRIENRHAPLYSLGIIDLKRQYATCGLVGINEAVEIMGMDILKEEGQKFVIRLLEKVNEINDKQQKKFECPHNCEQTPSESSAVVLASADKILGYNNEYTLYSNQFIPLTTKADILDRIMLQGLFDKYLSGGAICHLNFSEKITDKEFLRNLITKSIGMGVIYQAINYLISKCPNGHIFVGKANKCSVCGEKVTDRFTRIVGFLIPIKNWGKVRREEDFPERQWYGSE